MNKEEIKLYVEQVFSGNAVPENYTNRDHCDECAEHDETLRSCTPKSIGLEQLGNAGWDPICFVLPKAFKYYFPALVRLSLDSEGSNGYLDQFLFHVTYQGEGSRFFKHFSKAERGAKQKGRNVRQRTHHKHNSKNRFIRCNANYRCNF